MRAGSITFDPAPLPFPADIQHDRLAALGDVPVTPYREAIAATARIYRDLDAQRRLIGSEHGIPAATGAGGPPPNPRRRLHLRPPSDRRLADDRALRAYDDPLDGLAVPADLLLAWTARLVEAVGNGLVLDGDGGSFKSGTHRRPAATSSLAIGSMVADEVRKRSDAGLRRLGLDAR